MTAVDGAWAAATAYLVLAPHLALAPFLSKTNTQRVVEVVLLVAALCTLAWPSVRERWLGLFRRVPPLARAVAGAWLGWGVAAAVLAPRPAYAFAEIGLFGLLLAFAVLLASGLPVEAVRRYTGLALTATAACYAAFVFAHHPFDLWARGEVWPEVHRGYQHVRFYNQFQIWALPVLFALATEASGRRARFGFRLLNAATVTLLIASGGRGAALALLGAAGLVVLVGGAAGRRWLREALWAVMLGIGLYAALFLTAGIPPQSALERAGTGSTGRLEMWAAALRMIGHNPWFGVGPMHFAYYPNPHANSPHNIALQIAAEWGLPAALLGLGLLGWGVSRWIGAVRRSASGGGGEHGGWRVGLTGAVVAALLNLQLDGALIMGPSQVVAALMLAALLAEGLRAGEGRATPSGGGGRGRRFAQPVLVGAVLACVLAVGWVTVLDLPTLHRRHYDYRDVRLTPGAQPRYWSFGVIAPQEGMPEGWERYWPAVAREHASAVASAAGEGGAGDGTQER